MTPGQTHVRLIPLAACTVVSLALTLAAAGGAVAATSPAGAHPSVALGAAATTHAADASSPAMWRARGPAPRACRAVRTTAGKETPGARLARCLVKVLVTQGPVKMVQRDGDRAVGRFDYRRGMKVHVVSSTGTRMLLLPRDAWVATAGVAGGRWRHARQGSTDAGEAMAWTVSQLYRAFGNPRAIMDQVGHCPTMVSRGRVRGGVALECTAPFETQLLGLTTTISDWRVVLDPRTMRTSVHRPTGTASGQTVRMVQKFSRWGRAYDFEKVRREAVRQAG